MARYELSDGKSEKFWEIKVKGASFVTTYGRIGTDGQSKTKEFSDAKKAKAEAEKLTAQKVKKGYSLAGKSKKSATKKTAAKTATKKVPAKKKAPAKAAAKKTTTKKSAPKKAARTKGYRFELSDGKSNKFWEIELDGESYTVCYGRIGTDGSSSTKKLASAAAAKKKHDALIAEKASKGYVLVAGDLPKAMTVKAAYNTKMEAAIAKDPSDVSAWGVYFDWLQGQGDPRGELGAVQMALDGAKGATKTKLKKAETKLLADYGEYFVPSIVAEVQGRHAARKPKKSDKWRYRSWSTDLLDVSWGAGFISHVNLRKEYDEPRNLEEILDSILSHPSGRFLQSLEVGALNISDTYNYGPITKLLGKAKLPALRRLEIADFHSEQCELSWSSLGSLAPVWKSAPNLEEVVIRGGGFDLGKINLPKARSFSVRTGGLSSKNFQAIASAKWPSLEKLEVWFGTDRYGGSTSVKAVAKFLDGASIPKVTDLGLMNSELIDDLCKLLPKSKIAKRIVRLDLSMGIMTDAGAEALAANPKAFPKLQELNVDDNYLTAAGIKLLKKLAKNVSASSQDTPDDYGDDEVYRYVSVGE
jgi:uncharacterized protein (TIGR02996 family)